MVNTQCQVRTQRRAIKMLKFAMNLTDDGMVGQQVFEGGFLPIQVLLDHGEGHPLEPSPVQNMTVGAARANLGKG